MSKNTYKDMDKFYKHKREKRKEYYGRTKNASNGNKRFTEEEIDLILKHEVSDRELAEKLGRSMKAIQNARANYKKKRENTLN